MKSKAELMQAMRTQRAQDGLKKIELWLSPEHEAAVREFAASLAAPSTETRRCFLVLDSEGVSKGKFFYGGDTCVTRKQAFTLATNFKFRNGLASVAGGQA